MDSSVALQAMKSLVIGGAAVNPVLVLLPGPAQRGVRSSSLYTFRIPLKVLVLHSSVTIFTTNFLLSHFPPPAESSTSLASPFQKTSLLFFHSEMFSKSLKSLSKFDSQTTCRLTPTPSDDTLTASHFQTWLLTVQTEKKNCCLFFSAQQPPASLAPDSR